VSYSRSVRKEILPG